MIAPKETAGGAPTGAPLILPGSCVPDNVALYRTLHCVSPDYQQRNQGLALLEQWYGLIDPCETVLEVGCGNGRLCQWLASERDKQVTGVDLVCGPYIREGYAFLTLDVMRDELPRDFEAALCFDVLEHLETDGVAFALRNLDASAPVLALTIAGYGGPPHHLTVKSPGWWLNMLLSQMRPRQWLVQVFQRYPDKPSPVYLFMGTPIPT